MAKCSYEFIPKESSPFDVDCEKVTAICETSEEAQRWVTADRYIGKKEENKTKVLQSSDVQKIGNGQFQVFIVRTMKAEIQEKLDAVRAGKGHIEIIDDIDNDNGVWVNVYDSKKKVISQQAAGLNRAWEIAREYSEDFGVPVHPVKDGSAMGVGR